ncbi:cytochrome P450 CYP82D47-like [Corylus avellana]|uniref:cytochrome P450 CYP82D47-like n=1 Tax=Corylus avellana TaxID=13451 RepID=UPI00286B59B1|nr:cytochrome P450 CYP82D47-like [Corylus avellana]
MDPVLQFPSAIISTLLALLLLCVFVYQKKKPTPHKKTTCSIPQAGGAWPFIGHLHLLGDQQLTHKTLGAMADKYGPVFTINLGSHKVVVLSCWEMAKECFTVHDKIFSTRPTILASRVLGYENAMFGFAPYGPFWREMRKITTIELLSTHRLDMLKQKRSSQVEAAIRELFELCVGKGCAETGVLVEMKHWFGDLMLNVFLRMVAGKQCCVGGADCEEGEVQSFENLMGDVSFLFGVFVLSDTMPFLGWLDVNGYKKGQKAMKRTAKKLDSMIGRLLEEHKENRLLGGEGKEDQDFMDVMLTILGDAKISGFDADTINKATCLNLIIAGSDATMVLLTWTLSLLLNNQHVLRKAQDELNIHVGKDRHPDESDIKNLVYLQAIVKETLRLYPPAPIISLRAAMEDCTLSPGYHVPAGTRLMVNAWKIHRNKHLWPDPLKFQPERFLTSHKDIDVRGHNFELIPFGSGRRSCPGVSLALQLVHLTLASLLHAFDVTKPSNDDVDMTESPGLANLKATPLEVILTPRLNSRLYSQ